MPPAENISSPIGAYGYEGGSTSCGSGGFCASVGDYGSIAGDGLFVVPIRDGVAAPAVQLALPANAWDNGDGQLTGVSCWGADSCVAVGSYQAAIWNGDGWMPETEALAVPITGGQVGTAVEVALPTNAAPDSVGQDAQLSGVSCDPSGACVAVGSYLDDSGVVVDLSAATSAAPTVAVNTRNNTEAMVVPIAGSSVGSGVEVSPPSDTAIADSTGQQYAQLNSVSCEASGSCVAVGGYVDSSGDEQAMVVPVSSAGAPGTSTMLTLPADAAAVSAGTTRENDNSERLETTLDKVSCPASGSCAAIGDYYGANWDESMVTSISAAGVALPAVQVTATVANAADPTDAHANGVGCGTAGCDAVGSYYDTSGSEEALVIPVSGSGGATVLGNESEVTLPGDAVQEGPAGQEEGPTQGAWLTDISCPVAGPCLATGAYTADYQGLNGDGFDQENLNALLVGVSGASVDTGTSAPMPADAATDGRLSDGAMVGCGATGSCVVSADYLQGFSTTTQLLNTLSCLFSAGDYIGFGDGSCCQGGTEQPYVISAQAPLTIAPGSVTSTVTAGVTSISLASAGSGGWAPYKWSVAAGNSLPAGLSLDPFTGEISGTPQAAGTYSLWVRADSPGVPAQDAEASLALKVGAAATTATVVSSTSTTTVVSPQTTPVSPALGKGHHHAPSLIVVRGNLRDHGGAVKVHLRCHSWGRCTGTVKLTFHGHAITAAKHLSIPAGQTAWVTVQLNAAGMKDAAGLSKPHHGYPTMNVMVVPQLVVGQGTPHSRPMWVI